MQKKDLTTRRQVVRLLGRQGRVKDGSGGTGPSLLVAGEFGPGEQRLWLPPVQVQSSNPWFWYLSHVDVEGLSHSLLWGLPVCCKIFISSCCLYPNCDNQNRLQTSLHVPWGAPGHSGYNSSNSVFTGTLSAGGFPGHAHLQTEANGYSTCTRE